MSAGRARKSRYCCWTNWTTLVNGTQRKSGGGAFTTLTTTASTSATDNTAVAGTTYVYKVRAIDAASVASGFSLPDAATTIFFTDDPLVAQSTKLKALHITQLRQAVNAMRTAGGLTAASFTDASLTGVAAKAVHIQELRTALSQARTALGLGAVTFTNPTLTPGSTTIKAAHINELRNGVQ